MARPRNKANKDLPQGLYYKKERDIYIFYRIDGSSKSFKDKTQAKLAAFNYNRTYRVDQELVHGVYKDVKTSKRVIKQSKPLKLYLKDMFNRVCIDKQWKSSTEEVRRQQFEIVYSHFKDIPCMDVCLDDVNEFLASYDNPNDHNRYNRYLYMTNLVFNMCVDQGLMEINPASKKIRKTIKSIPSASRTRLTFDDFRKIHSLAGEKGDNWLQVAMELAMQTSQGVNEVAFMKYKDIEENHLKVIRKKTENNEASHVKIPVSTEILRILSKSRTDNVLSPYVVHRRRDKRYRGRTLGKGITHETQVPREKISRRFSELRDSLGIQSNLPKDKRSGFHDIRALSIHWQERNGFNSMTRAAHSDEKSNKIYREGHVDWKIAEDVTIEWKQAN